MSRDFTYIVEIVEGVIRIQDVVLTKNKGWTVEEGSPATSSAPYAVYNIGNGHPVQLMDYIKHWKSHLALKRRKTSEKCSLVMCTKLMPIHKTCLRQQVIRRRWE